MLTIAKTFFYVAMGILVMAFGTWLAMLAYVVLAEPNKTPEDSHDKWVQEQLDKGTCTREELDPHSGMVFVDPFGCSMERRSK